MHGHRCTGAKVVLDVENGYNIFIFTRRLSLVVRPSHAMSGQLEVKMISIIRYSKYLRMLSRVLMQYLRMISSISMQSIRMISTISMHYLRIISTISMQYLRMISAGEV